MTMMSTPTTAVICPAWCSVTQSTHERELRWEGLYSVIPRDSGYYLVSKASWELLGTAIGF